MFVIGSEKTIPYNYKVYNLGNLLEYGHRLNLVPPIYRGYDIYESEANKGFDMFYFNNIMSNDNMFIDFFLPIYDIYNGLNVYIIVGDGDFKENLTESLCKIYQQRYGIIPSVILSIEDLDYVEEVEFSIFGLENLDIDKFRFASKVIRDDIPVI